MAERKLKVWKVRILVKDGNETVLIRAKSAAQAQGHACLKHMEIAEATPDDCVTYGVQGGKIEEAVT